MRLLVGLVVACVVGCSSTGPLPQLTIPQYQHAKESVEGGIGKNYEDHAACKKTSTNAKMMVECMDVAGYDYVRRSAEPRVTECWRLRDTNATDPLPDTFCFVRRTTSATPTP